MDDHTGAAQDANAAPGPSLNVGDTVTWTYEIENTGDVALENVTLSDNEEAAVAIPATGAISGDTDSDRVLDVDETWVITHTGTAVSGQYANTGTVSAEDIVSGDSVQDSDDSHYFASNPDIDIVKFTDDDLSLIHI